MHPILILFLSVFIWWLIGYTTALFFAWWDGDDITTENLFDVELVQVAFLGPILIIAGIIFIFCDKMSERSAKVLIKGRKQNESKED